MARVKASTQVLDAAALCRVGRRPNSDAGYLEAMASAIFRMGFSRVVVESKWPAFHKAFDGFSVDRVSNYSAGDLRRLMADAGIIRNRGKIWSVVENARVLREIRIEDKGFERYLGRQLNQLGEAGLIKELGFRFSRLGPKTALVFLRMTGYEMAETMNTLATFK